MLASPASVRMMFAGPASNSAEAADGELKQIQRTARPRIGSDDRAYLGTKQDLVNAPNDGIKPRVAV